MFRRNGSVRWQLPHANVQNSSRTTRPCSPATVSGSPPAVLRHGCTPNSSGAGPRSGSPDPLALAAGRMTPPRRTRITTTRSARRGRSRRVSAGRARSCRPSDRGLARNGSGARGTVRTSFAHEWVRVRMNGVLHHARFRRDHRWAPGQMSAYLDGDLASRARARLERHTGECPECRGVLHSLRRMLLRLHGLPTDAHRAPDIARAVSRRLHEPSDG